MLFEVDVKCDVFVSFVVMCYGDLGYVFVMDLKLVVLMYLMLLKFVNM